MRYTANTVIICYRNINDNHNYDNNSNNNDDSNDDIHSDHKSNDDTNDNNNYIFDNLKKERVLDKQAEQRQLITP